MLANASISPAIPAGDLDRAKAFYGNTLGLAMVSDDAAAVVFACGGGSRLYLYPTPSAGQAAHTLAGWEVADITAEMGELRQRGVQFEEYDLPQLKTVDGVAELGGYRSCWFKDSEGNILGLVQPPAG